LTRGHPLKVTSAVVVVGADVGERDTVGEEVPVLVPPGTEMLMNLSVSTVKVPSALLIMVLFLILTETIDVMLLGLSEVDLGKIIVATKVYCVQAAALVLAVALVLAGAPVGALVVPAAVGAIVGAFVVPAAVGFAFWVVISTGVTVTSASVNSTPPFAFVISGFAINVFLIAPVDVSLSSTLTVSSTVVTAVSL